MQAEQKTGVETNTDVGLDLGTGTVFHGLSETGEYRLRNRMLAAVVSVEAELIRGARKYFEENGFTEVVVPHLTKATGACENIATMFDVDYFGQKAYLVQTGQLYLESLIPKLGNVFCVGPSFRAEGDVDNRHLTEFTLVEFELPCDFGELLAHIEGTVQSMVRSVIKNRKEELDLLGVETSHLKRALAPFPRIGYADAVRKLQETGFDVEWGDDLKSAHEKSIVAETGKPTFITHYPEKIKFFNMFRAGGDTVNSADLILPNSCEAVGSAQREHRYNVLEEKLRGSQMLRLLEAKGGTIEDFRWYLDFVKEFPVQHSGCGIGLNRVTQFVLGSGDIRTTTAYPMNRVSLM